MLSLSLIDGYAFYDCSSIKSINFSNCSKLTTIKQCAFNDCSSITSVNLSSSKTLSLIGAEAFGGCLSIKDIKVNSDTYHTLELGNGKVVVKNDQTWTNDSKVVGCLACGDILFPDNITQIAMYSFEKCSSLTSIKFSKDSKLTTIDRGAFSSCVSLKSIFLPSELFSFNTDCFKNCSNLSYIEWNCTLDFTETSGIGLDAFLGISETGNLKCTSTKHTSQELLDWIKGKGNFPTSGWTVAC